MQTVRYHLPCAMSLCSLLLCVLIVTCLFCGCRQDAREIFEVNSVAEYGTITGNYDNETPKEFIFSFFPEEIEDYFTDITYHYKAIKGDTYAYEAYLEFVISDTQKFLDYVSNYENSEICSTFVFDESFMEYTVSNEFMLVSGAENDAESSKYISLSKVGKVLFSHTEQRVIFVALGMYDGGGATTSELGFFFEKFNIDPIVFEKRAWPHNQ